MSKCFTGVLVIFALVFSVSSLNGAEKVTVTSLQDGLVKETFANSLGEFDTAVNNRSTGNDWGWSKNNNAGGSVGELGGKEKRSGDGYVCDATLGGSLTEKDTIIIKGKGSSLSGTNR